MEAYTADEIVELPNTKRELDHISRKRIGYHVYLSYYFVLFNKLTYDEKKSVMYLRRIWIRNETSDVDSDSDDSVLTARTPQYYEITRAAALYWNSLSIQYKAAWTLRARALNSRPPNDGRFEKIPDQLIVDDDTTSSIHKNIIIQSLSSDWMNLTRLFKNAMIRFKMNIKTSTKIYRFGNDCVLLSSQSYKSFFLNYLLKVSIFGYPLFSLLLPHELIQTTKKQSILHLYSYQRVYNLFTFGGVSAATIKKNGKKLLCCCKVNLRKGGKNIIGYVMEEDGNTLKVMLNGNTMDDDLVDVERPLYDVVNGTFVFAVIGDSGTQSQIYQLSEIWPIRIKIDLSGQSSFIINTCIIDDFDANN